MTFLAQMLLAAADDQEVIKLDRWLIFIGVTQAIIFVFQLFVFGYQAWKLDQTVKAVAQQSSDMERSINQATRAADATEKFAASTAIASKAATESVATTKDTMTRLLRAYLCINFGSAAFQKAETNFKFEVRLQLINAGQTPGYKVSYKAHADVLPFPLPPDFDFSLPDIPTPSQSTLGHGQSLILTGIVDRIYSEQEVAEIRSGLKRLYMFGTAIYEDVYHVSRYTNFCLSVLCSLLEILWVYTPSVTMMLTTN
jgi:hypothetical protein